MMFRPRAGRPPVLRGRFAFTARHCEAGEIEDAFDLEIEIPVAFPRDVPVVTEIGGRIPRDANYHVNTSDNTLCLGSPLRLRQLLAADPTLTGFAEKCLIPYLFAQSRNLASHGGFAFGELAHGLPGMLEDYVALFGVKETSEVVEVLRLLGMKTRQANKMACPCGCRRRLGRCPFNARLAKFREVANRPWFRAEREKILEAAKLSTDRAECTIEKRERCRPISSAITVLS
jgi:hypothetical protein